MRELEGLLMVFIIITWPIVCRAEIEHVWKSHRKDD